MALPPRSLPSVVIATRHPLLRPPMTLNSGARQPSMYSWLKPEPPVAWRSGRMVMPLSFIGASTNDSPRCLGASGSVRHRMKIQLARWAPEVQTFWPVMTISSPSTVPRVSTPARSDPWSGSENPWQ